MLLFSFLLFDFTPFIYRVFLLISLSVCVLLRSALCCVLAIGLDLDIGFEKKKRQKKRGIQIQREINIQTNYLCYER